MPPGCLHQLSLASPTSSRPTVSDTSILIGTPPPFTAGVVNRCYPSASSHPLCHQSETYIKSHQILTPLQTCPARCPATRRCRRCCLWLWRLHSRGESDISDSPCFFISLCDWFCGSAKSSSSIFNFSVHNPPLHLAPWTCPDNRCMLPIHPSDYVFH